MLADRVLGLAALALGIAVTIAKPEAACAKWKTAANQAAPPPVAWHAAGWRWLRRLAGELPRAANPRPCPQAA